MEILWYVYCGIERGTEERPAVLAFGGKARRKKSIGKTKT
jgi:hypothetical protein